MRKVIFEEGEYYHVYDRGADGRPIFIDDRDRIRFVHTLYILNNFQTIPDHFDLYTLEPKEFLIPIQPYVSIVAGCLMDNHYHFMLSPLCKGGVSSFMQKIGISHTSYFNKRHERIGRIFGSPFNARHVERQEYASYLTQYIHLNAVKLFQTRFGTGKSADELLKLVESYEWSSLPDYLGKKSKFFIALSSSFREFQNEILGLKPEEYKKVLQELFYEQLSKG